LQILSKHPRKKPIAEQIEALVERSLMVENTPVTVGDSPLEGALGEVVKQSFFEGESGIANFEVGIDELEFEL